MSSVYRVSQSGRRLIEEGESKTAVTDGSSSSLQVFSQAQLTQHFSEQLKVRSLQHVRTYAADGYRLAMVGASGSAGRAPARVARLERGL